MKTTFDIKRLTLLLKRFFTENLQRELTFWGITTIVLTILHQEESIKMFLYISGFIFAARQFKHFAYTPGGMHYLLIPATHFEKVLASVLISTIYYFGMFVISYVIGHTAGIGLGNMLFNLNLPYEYSFLQTSTPELGLPAFMQEYAGESIFKTFGTFAFLQALFLMGSVIFKRNAVIKTMLSVVGFGIILLIVQLLLVKMLYGTYSINSADFVHINFNSINSSSVEVFSNIMKFGTYALVPFFWIVSYFKLTEKEI